MKIRSICFVVVSFWSLNAHAAALVDLGTADSFAVLGGSAVTNTGPTVIQGDLGVSPGSAITGFPPGIVNGTTHSADAIAGQAHNDLITAYNFAAGELLPTDLTGQDLGGLTLTPGVYFFSSSAQLTGTLTLDGLGDPNAIFVFQIGSTLTTASSSSVGFINGGQGDNVFWQVGSSATLGTATEFAGNILALTSITLTTGTNIEDGRALAINGAVTLDTNNIFIGEAVPEPSTWAMLLLGFAGIGFMAYRRKSAAIPA
jgi:Ice-binding-like/PEP-CTERM motif